MKTAIICICILMYLFLIFFTYGYYVAHHKGEKEVEPLGVLAGVFWPGYWLGVGVMKCGEYSVRCWEGNPKILELPR